MVRLLLVRHGHSAQNFIVNKYFNGKVPPTEEEMNNFVDENGLEPNPTLSPQGEAQANALAEYFKVPFERIKKEGNKILLLSSFMQRAYKTLLPLAKAISQDIYIHDECHEVNTSGPPYPGMIKMAKLMAANGKSIINQSAKELHELEPRLNTTKYCKNQTGPIVKDFHPGIQQYECYYPDDENWKFGMPQNALQIFANRAAKLQAWLQSDEIQNQYGKNDLIVIASHGAILSILSHMCLLGRNIWKFNPNLKNASTSLFNITADRVELGFYNNEHHLLRSSNPMIDIDLSSRLISGGNKMHVMFLRHGESTQNILTGKYLDYKTVPTNDAILKMMSEGGDNPNPELSTNGRQQVSEFTSYYLNSFKTIIDDKNCKVKFCSTVLKRGWESILTLAKRCNSDVYIRPDLHEITGHGKPGPGVLEWAKLWAIDNKDRLYQTGEELHAVEPILNTAEYCNLHSPILTNGSLHYPIKIEDVYDPKTFGIQEPFWNVFIKRCENVLAWLQSKELQNEMNSNSTGGGLVVLSSHGGFLSVMSNNVILGRDWWRPTSTLINLNNTATCIFEVTENYCELVSYGNEYHKDGLDMANVLVKGIPSANEASGGGAVAKL